MSQAAEEQADRPGNTLKHATFQASQESIMVVFMRIPPEHASYAHHSLFSGCPIVFRLFAFEVG